MTNEKSKLISRRRIFYIQYFRALVYVKIQLAKNKIFSPVKKLRNCFYFAY